MSAADRDSDEIYLEHPNRDKAGSKLTRLAVVVLLLLSALLLVILSVGGWERTVGAKPVQVFYVVLYLLFAFLVARWSRGVLPVVAAFAIILLIFAVVSAPGWYDRADVGFAETTLDAELMGLLCFVLAAVQVVLIISAMRGFQQAWNVEVEHARDQYEPERSGRDGRGGRGGYAPATPA